MSHFEFTAEERQLAHQVLIKNGIHDAEKRDERIANAQQTGEIALFAYGSLLHTVHTSQAMTQTRAHVKDMGARFNQAWTYYGGEEGRYTMMLGLQPLEGEEAHGLIQRVKIDSAAEFIEFYDALQVRENPVNNPIYSFNDVVEVHTEDGETVSCLTCLTNQDGPLYVGDQMTEDEIALILAHAYGSEQRLDSNQFRQVDGSLEGVEYIDLLPYQHTGAAYAFHYLSSYREWGFPENEYLERMVKKVNEVRGKMWPDGRRELEAIEDRSDRPEGLSTRFQHNTANVPKTVTDQTFRDFVAANDKLNAVLFAKPVFQAWEREWD